MKIKKKKTIHKFFFFQLEEYKVDKYPSFFASLMTTWSPAQPEIIRLNSKNIYIKMVLKMQKALYRQNEDRAVLGVL